MVGICDGADAGTAGAAGCAGAVCGAGGVCCVGAVCCAGAICCARAGDAGELVCAAREQLPSIRETTSQSILRLKPAPPAVAAPLPCDGSADTPQEQ